MHSTVVQYVLIDFVSPQAQGNQLQFSAKIHYEIQDSGEIHPHCQHF